MRFKLQRQIEISTLLEAFKDSMGKVSSTSEESIDEGNKIVLLCSMFDMLSALVNICNDENKKVVRCLMVQNFILESILEAMENFEVRNIIMVLYSFSLALVILGLYLLIFYFQVHNELLHSCFRTIAEIIKSEDFSKVGLFRCFRMSLSFQKVIIILFLSLFRKEW